MLAAGTQRGWLELTESNQKLICFDLTAWLGYLPGLAHCLVTRTGQASRCHEHDFCFNPQTHTGVVTMSQCHTCTYEIADPSFLARLGQKMAKQPDQCRCSAVEQFLLFGVLLVLCHCSVQCSGPGWDILASVYNLFLISHAMIPSQPRSRER